MMTSAKTLLLSLGCLVAASAMGQQVVNLADEFREKRIIAVNRDISLYPSQAGAVELNALPGSGLGILEGTALETGIIEVELLGENSPGRSFIGIAFNMLDKDTYEAVYFRPFNFVADEQASKDHMVQYISHPENTWSKLREERTGEFENEIPAPPDPDQWFRAILKITDTRVEVFVDEIPEPVLQVERLTSVKSKNIALWTGHGSSGRYRNLVIRGE